MGQECDREIFSENDDVTNQTLVYYCNKGGESYIFSNYRVTMDSLDYFLSLNERKVYLSKRSIELKSLIIERYDRPIPKMVEKTFTVDGKPGKVVRRIKDNFEVFANIYKLPEFNSGDLLRPTKELKRHYYMSLLENTRMGDSGEEFGEEECTLSADTIEEEIILNAKDTVNTQNRVVMNYPKESEKYLPTETKQVVSYLEHTYCDDEEDGIEINLQDLPVLL